MNIIFSIIIESIIFCIIFTLSLVFWLTRERGVMAQIHNYPPKIIERVKELGQLPDDYIEYGKKQKCICLPIYLLGIIILPILFAQISTFLEAWIHVYAIIIIWVFYDSFILDCLIFCRTKLFIIPGTEDMTKEYHNYWFHIKYAIISIPLMTIVALIPAGILF
eukprot:jgi/Orpsp1_1/1184583/evm.model.c7180000090095.1